MERKCLHTQKNKRRILFMVINKVNDMMTLAQLKETLALESNIKRTLKAYTEAEAAVNPIRQYAYIRVSVKLEYLLLETLMLLPEGEREYMMNKIRSHTEAAEFAMLEERVEA